jgi:hypothetical protein
MTTAWKGEARKAFTSDEEISLANRFDGFL